MRVGLETAAAQLSGVLLCVLVPRVLTMDFSDYECLSSNIGSGRGWNVSEYTENGTVFFELWYKAPGFRSPMGYQDYQSSLSSSIPSAVTDVLSSALTNCSESIEGRSSLCSESLFRSFCESCDYNAELNCDDQEITLLSLSEDFWSDIIDIRISLIFDHFSPLYNEYQNISLQKEYLQNRNFLVSNDFNRSEISSPQCQSAVPLQLSMDTGLDILDEGHCFRLQFLISSVILNGNNTDSSSSSSDSNSNSNSDVNRTDSIRRDLSLEIYRYFTDNEEAERLLREKVTNQTVDDTGDIGFNVVGSRLSLNLLAIPIVIPEPGDDDDSDNDDNGSDDDDDVFDAPIEIQFAVFGVAIVALLFGFSGSINALIIGADSTRHFAIVVFVVYFLDFYGDIVFSLQILDTSFEKRTHIGLWLMFVFSMLFIFGPISQNMYKLLRYEARWNSSGVTHIQGWLTQYSTVLHAIALLSGSAFGAVEVCNSNLFSMDVCCMCLSERDLKAFRSERLVANVILQNVPQLILQIIFGVQFLPKDEFLANESLRFAMITSVASIIFNLFDQMAARLMLQSQAETINSLESLSVEFEIFFLNSEVSSQRAKQLQITTNILRDRIAQCLQVDEFQIAVHRPMIIQNGFKLGLTIYSGKIRVDLLEVTFDQTYGEGKMHSAIKEAWGLKSLQLGQTVSKTLMVMAEEEGTEPQPVLREVTFPDNPRLFRRDNLVRRGTRSMSQRKLITSSSRSLPQMVPEKPLSPVSDREGSQIPDPNINRHVRRSSPPAPIRLPHQIAADPGAPGSRGSKIVKPPAERPGSLSSAMAAQHHLASAAAIGGDREDDAYMDAKEAFEHRPKAQTFDSWIPPGAASPIPMMKEAELNEYLGRLNMSKAELMEKIALEQAEILRTIQKSQSQPELRHSSVHKRPSQRHVSFAQQSIAEEDDADDDDEQAEGDDVGSTIEGGHDEDSSSGTVNELIMNLQMDIMSKSSKRLTSD